MASMIPPPRFKSQPQFAAQENAAHPLQSSLVSLFLFNTGTAVHDAGPYSRQGVFVAASAIPVTQARVGGRFGAVVGPEGLAGGATRGYVDFGTSLTQRGYSFGTGDFWTMAVFSSDGYVNNGSGANFLWGNTNDSAYSAGWAFSNDSASKLYFDVGGVITGSVSTASVADGKVHCAVGARINSTAYLWIDGVAYAGVGGKTASVSSSSNNLQALSTTANTARPWKGGIYAAAVGFGTISNDAALALSNDPWSLWQPAVHPVYFNSVAGGTTNATIAATETTDNAAIAATVTTGADIAATETTDNAAIVAANWTTAQLAATETTDNAAINATVTTGADIAATETTDNAAIVADATGVTSASIAATETTDNAAIAVTVTTGADILALDASDSIIVIADAGAGVGGARFTPGPYYLIGGEVERRIRAKIKKKIEDRIPDDDIASEVEDAVESLIEGATSIAKPLKAAIVDQGLAWRNEYARVAKDVAREVKEEVRIERRKAIARDDEEIMLLLS